MYANVVLWQPHNITLFISCRLVYFYPLYVADNVIGKVPVAFVFFFSCVVFSCVVFSCLSPVGLPSRLFSSLVLVLSFVFLGLVFMRRSCLVLSSLVYLFLVLFLLGCPLISEFLSSCVGHALGCSVVWCRHIWSLLRMLFLSYHLCCTLAFYRLILCSIVVSWLRVCSFIWFCIVGNYRFIDVLLFPNRTASISSHANHSRCCYSSC